MRYTSAVIALVVSLVGSSGSGQNTTIRLWDGAAPGSETWTQRQRVVDTPLGRVVFNVVTPTLTAFLPEESRAVGTAVIIAPGGAFVALALDLEGNDLARWLQARGIAAFVLKYRLVEKTGEGIPHLDQDEAAKYGIADAIKAVTLVRARAAEWHLARDRVGMIGFSAGAMVTAAAVLQPNAADRPDFGALIYGAPFGRLPPIPAGLPPLFMAWAQDDDVALGLIVRFSEALVAAGYKPERHIFGAGGHGFGMRQQGTTSDHWIDQFYAWLAWQGYTKPLRLAAKQRNRLP